MNKNFLVTVSNDHGHLTGIDFICSFFKELSEHELTLLHICRLDSHDMNTALMEMWESPDNRVTGKMTIGAKKALDKALKILSKSKMSVNEMVVKTFAERYGKVKDILNEGKSGLYDAIVLGKRASYTLQWFFERPADETAKSIIQDASLHSPLWICPKPEIGRKNVLVGVDGSENSLRAVDHVGYVLSRQDQHNIQLIHVDSVMGGESEMIFTRSRQILRGHAISDDRISDVTVWGINAASTIHSYAEKNNFAAIAVGLKGTNQDGLLKRLNLTGATTASLIEKTEEISLWCCP